MSSSYGCFNLLPSPFRIQEKSDYQNLTHNVKSPNNHFRLLFFLHRKNVLSAEYHSTTSFKPGLRGTKLIRVSDSPWMRHQSIACKLPVPNFSGVDLRQCTVDKLSCLRA